MNGPPLALDDPGRIVDTGEVELWCSDLGEGDPLFLIGGLTAGHHVWDFARPYLDELRTITWEPRGLGRSARPAGPYSVELWAEDLARLLDVLGVERTNVWAGGFGNYIAVRFAAAYPDRVARNVEEVVHVDTAARTVGYCLTEADVRDDLPGIRAPFLVVQGDIGWAGERVDPDDDPSLEVMREAMPQLEVAVIPGAHAGYVLAQRPQECAETVLEFLRRHPL